jgi:hypothetical protein
LRLDRGCRRDRELGLGKARIELVDEALAVEPEVLRVLTKEAGGVRSSGKSFEALILERLQMARTDARRLLRLGELQTLGDSCLAEAIPDLETRRPDSTRSSQSVPDARR